MMVSPLRLYPPNRSLPQFLDNHLRNTRSSKRLARRETLSLQSSQRIECRRNEQEDGRGDQTADINNKTEPLYDAHDQIDGGAHIVGLESADELIELGRGWAYPEQKGNFDEEEDERGNTICRQLRDLRREAM